jgi:ribosomal protein L11 methyltransferase
VDCPVESVEMYQTICWESGSAGLVEKMSPESGFDAYFSSREALFQCAHTLLEYSDSQDRYLQIKILEVADENWSEKWHAYFKPIKIGEQFVARPPWEDYHEADRKSVIINPGQAFGTGYHESTQLMIMMMETVSLSRAVVVDVGTGSGILAICARLLGAARIVGLDIDLHAMIEARRNAGLNHMDHFFGYTGSPESMRRDSFDVTLANLDFPTLSHLSPDLIRMTKQGGHLLLSGILQENVPELIALFAANGAVHMCSRNRSDWASMVLRKS